ncbi:hypothetical protein PZA11_005610 [Diplocarpon coronariae]|nr:hypothetical protein JHW43_000041 [Diplocarpon mali]
MSVLNNRRGGPKAKVGDLKTTEPNGAKLIRDYNRLPAAANGSSLSQYQVLLLCRKPPGLRHAQASLIFDRKGRTFYSLGHDSYFTDFTDATIASVNLTRDQLPRPASGGHPKKSRAAIKQSKENEEAEEKMDEDMDGGGDGDLKNRGDGGGMEGEKGDEGKKAKSVKKGKNSNKGNKGNKGKEVERGEQAENAATDSVQLTWLMSANGPKAAKYFAEFPPPANNGSTSTFVTHMSELSLVLVGLDYGSLVKQVKDAVQQLRYMPEGLLKHFFPCWICLRYFENDAAVPGSFGGGGGVHDDKWMVGVLASELDMTAAVMNALMNPRVSRCTLEVGFDYASSSQY